ncbi:AraC family transcriptional regulator [Paenibacillus sp. N4]|uniref:helix-turn-helix domain-containing protein n=1 Tax=Paenibacillus vietnamensis TaxID=2590547 RepID=UPI001CD06FB5|nr:AraC family transcriptional regulator [Paenibacillus vietnamensis]MCA0758492.1 AraC family transcriptional regulator [Paenibacillus vietnamensis]
MLAVNIETMPRMLLMGFVSYKNPWLHFKRNLNEYVLYFVRSGELHLKEEDRRYVLKKGDWLILEPNMTHEGTEKHACDYYYIHFEHPDVVSMKGEDTLALAQYYMTVHDQSPYHENKPLPPHEGLHLYSCCIPKACAVTEQGRYRKMLHDMNEMLQQYKRRHFNRSLTALKFTEVLIGLSRDTFMDELQRGERFRSKAIVKVNALLDHIHQNYQHKITGADIERLFECSYDYLNREFKKVTGQPISRYMNAVRIGQAKELIGTTSLGMGEIGYLTGLNDPYHFSKLFKKHTGMSPTEYFNQTRDDR